MNLKKYESKSVTPVDQYVCSLSQELQQILEKEIRETEEGRNHAITALREWAMQNQRIKKMRLDSSWLLKHLRFKKYSVPMAQEAMERHLVLRAGNYCRDNWHLELDVLRPCVKKIFDVNPVCFLPERDAHGRAILFFRFSQVKPDSSPCILQDILTAFAVLMEAISEEEELLIRGIVYVFDISGFSVSYLKIAPVEKVIKLLRNSEKCLSGRHKGFHFVNMSPAMSTFFNLGIRSAPAKMRERIRFYNNFDQLNIIEKKHLPKEYGGTIPMAELCKSVWDLVLKYRPLHLLYQEMKVANDMYPLACIEGNLEMLKIPLSSDDLFERASRCDDDSIFGVQGSFRKLEID